MKKILTIVILCLSLSTFAQNITDQAAKPSDKNQNDDPITNIMDQDGMRQGDWFFVDTDANEVVKKTYTDNVCTSTYFMINGVWVNSTDYELDKDKSIQILDKLIYAGITFTKDKQFLVVLSISSGIELMTSLGLWSIDELNILNQTIDQSDFLIGPNTPQKTYILL